MTAMRLPKEMTWMTENYPTVPTPPQPDESLPLLPEQEQGTADIVKDQAADLSHSGIQAGQHAAEVVREQASGVAAEVSRQGRNLLRQAQDQLGEQAAQGQQRLATGLLSLSDQLGSMADGSSPESMAAELARRTASRARDAGQWLGDRRPAQVVDEVQSFARQRPGVFLALAVGAGLVAGRLTRGMKAAGDDPAPPGGLPATGDVPVWDAGPAHGERSPLVTDDQAGAGGAR
jgi:hypothetical protein